ncbi:MAG: double zinc ribbon domain-containing protein, partial [Gammaproteobacteria bacterium]
FPHTCVLCAERANQPRDLCSDCEKELPWASLACKQCGLRIPASATSAICGQCQISAPAFNYVFALCDYEEPIDRLITAAKFNHQLVYTRLLGELIAQKAQQNWYKQQPMPDLLLPVPLHHTRLRERGYNQALEIAKYAAKKLKMSLGKQYCKRIKATLPQSSLAHNERDQNVKDAFVLQKPLSVKHVAIIDDIITTGHTVDEMSKTLRQAGVERIDIWCCARTQWK